MALSRRRIDELANAWAGDRTGSLAVAVNADASIADLGVVASGMRRWFACHEAVAAPGTRPLEACGPRRRR